MPAMPSPSWTHSSFIKRKRQRREVSFAGDHVKPFSADSTVQRRSSKPTCSSIHEIKEILADLSLSQLKSDSEGLKQSLRSIKRDSWTSPLTFLRKGNTTTYVDLRTRKSLRISCTHLLGKAAEDRDFAKKILIIKRGYTISELFRKSRRDIFQDKYINSIVQLLYEALSTSLKRKTDQQWLESRTKQRQTRLSKSRHSVPSGFSSGLRSKHTVATIVK